MCNFLISHIGCGIECRNRRLVFFPIRNVHYVFSENFSHTHVMWFYWLAFVLIWWKWDEKIVHDRKIVLAFFFGSSILDICAHRRYVGDKQLKFLNFLLKIVHFIISYGKDWENFSDPFIVIFFEINIVKYTKQAKIKWSKTENLRFPVRKSSSHIKWYEFQIAVYKNTNGLRMSAGNNSLKFFMYPYYNILYE